MTRRKRTVARHGEKTIELTVRFWTDDISKKPGHIVKKECWDAGAIYLTKNPSHGIEASESIPFNSLMQLAAEIEKLLIKAGIKLHLGRTSSRYFRR